MIIDFRFIVVSVLAFIVIYGSVFWLLIYFQGSQERERDPKPKEHPPVTIIIPAYNEEEHIEKAIESALNLKYKGEKKVIVVNDGSTDRTGEIALKYYNQGRIELIDKPNSGKADSLNKALERVKTPLYACLDADSIVDENALENMVGYFNDPEVAAVTPSMKVYKPKKLLQKLQWIEYLVSILMRKMSALIDVITVTPGPFSVYRTKVIKELGGYDTNTLTEDMEIAYRLHSKGYRIENSLNAVVYTVAPSTVKELFIQRIRWTRGSYQNLSRYSHMLLNKKYGNIGLFFLPFSIILIALTPLGLAFYGYMFIDWVSWVFQTVKRWFLYGFYVNFDLQAFIFSFNAYYTIIGLLVLGAGMAIIFLGHKVSKEKVSLKMRLAYIIYIFFYLNFLNIMWIISFFEELFGVERKW